MTKKHPYGYDHTTGEGQKRLMYESIGFDITKKQETPSYYEDGETGSDPILDDNGNPTGKIKMYPTGRIVDRTTRLNAYQPKK